ncbi:MAG: amino acid permease [Pseudomonadales bacterium]
MARQPVLLKRIIGLPLITFYGIGTILGAGIYVLVGKVAVASGAYAPIAFLVAALVVAFTALTYAELSSRFPKSAGEAVYVLRAFSWKSLSLLVGFSVVLSGIVSAAVMARGFAGYLSLFVSLPDALSILLFVALLASIAAWGVAQSVLLSAVITLIELAGVVVLLWVTGDEWIPALDNWQDYVPPFTSEVWLGITLGAFLAFYAYIGFEDMVNMAEEVKDPQRNLPRAIVLSLLVTSILYVLVAWAAVTSLPLEKLASSRAPFSSIVEQNGLFPVWAMTLISLIAISNGALVQIIMGARVLYGLANQGLLPTVFAKLNSRTRTPVIATLLIGVLVLVLAWLFPIETLAKITSSILLIVFALVNLALLVIKQRERNGGKTDLLQPHVRYPVFIPVIGFMLCLALLFIPLIQTL